MKQLAMGLFLLSFVLSANPNGFAQTQEQLIAGAKRKASWLSTLRQPRHSCRCTLPRSTKGTLSSKLNFRTGKQKLVSKILFEEQAKQHIADVIHTSVIETNILKKRGALSRHVPNEAASYPSQYKDPEGYWTSAYASGTLFWDSTVARSNAPRRPRPTMIC